MKRLFVCCDGTWNAPTNLHDGVPVPTNVSKFYNAIADRGYSPAHGSIEQRRYYHPGVGTGESLLRGIWDGFIGRGLARHVKSAYKWLADNYAARDEIFIVGFSRGAFTARSVVGFINRCGLPPTPGWPLVDEAFALYRRDMAAAGTAEAVAQFRQVNPSPPGLAIEFLGVWDTVGALGIPRIFTLGLTTRRNRFHDLTLSPLVKHAHQALAIDEMRASFTPTLWVGDAAPGQTVEQVWFAGVHSDIGGGYRENGLSDQALWWIVDRALLRQAAFHKHMLAQLHPDADGVLHDSYTGIYRFLRTQPRSLPDLANVDQATPLGQRTHLSVQNRRERPPISQAPYRASRTLQQGESETLEIYAQQRWNATGLYLTQGATFEFKATGQWQNGRSAIAPQGRSRGIRRRIPGLRSRAPDAPHFCLVGCVGDARNPSVSGDPGDMTTFVIGAAATWTAAQPGYLYCYANDGWHSYYNNRGSVCLSVTRVA